ncbi:hypothetical protein F5X98DRAFT_378312 [Xylaria grammica]|nr:hypothetical protein F5X98DRAFT_378312 [Xylaria grammica]
MDAIFGEIVSASPTCTHRRRVQRRKHSAPGLFEQENISPQSCWTDILEAEEEGFGNSNVRWSAGPTSYWSSYWDTKGSRNGRGGPSITPVSQWPGRFDDTDPTEKVKKSNGDLAIYSLSGYTASNGNEVYGSAISHNDGIHEGSKAIDYSEGLDGTCVRDYDNKFGAVVDEGHSQASRNQGDETSEASGARKDIDYADTRTRRDSIDSDRAGDYPTNSNSIDLRSQIRAGGALSTTKWSMASRE